MIERRAANVLRAWAGLDLLITGLLVLPPVAGWLIDTLMQINGWLGGQTLLTDSSGFAMLFVGITGTLGVVWATTRLLAPTRRLGAIDAVARLWIGGLIVYFVCFRNVPGILLLFVITEWAGGVHQAYRLLGADARPAQNNRERSAWR